MVYDFHTHSTLSDGELSPIELIRRAVVAGYRGMAITDHAGVGQLERFAHELRMDCEMATAHWGISVYPGVELTHTPAGAVEKAAQEAKRLGARIVIVHGETIAEPVEGGTNLAAVTCGYVDVLAHPGLMTAEVAALAARNDVFIELSGKATHAFTNGHVAKVAKAAGARLVVNSDNHVLDFLSEERVREIILGAGLDESDVEEIAIRNPQLLLEKLGAVQVTRPL